MEKIFNFLAPLNLAVTDMPAEVAAADAVASFSGVAYTGGIVCGNVVIDLSRTTVDNSNLPLLYEHERECIVGVVLGVDNDGEKIAISGNLFIGDEEGLEIQTKSKLGIKYQLSIGIYGASLSTESNATINGRTFDMPVDILHGGIIREVSVVVLGADPETNIDIFKQGEEMTSLKKDLDAALLRAKKAEELIKTHKVEQLFARCGVQDGVNKAKHFLQLPDEAFSGISEIMLNMARPSSKISALFTEQVIEQPVQTKSGISSLDIYKSRYPANKT
jgi:hypothetical protein